MKGFSGAKKAHMHPDNPEHRTLCGQRNFGGKKYGFLVVVSYDEFFKRPEMLRCKKCENYYEKNIAPGLDAS